MYFSHRNASPTNENSSESGSDGSSSGDSSSDENSKNGSEKEISWSLSTFLNEKKPINSSSTPTVPEIKAEPNADIKTKTESVKGKNDQKKFLSPKCLINDQIKQEPIGE